MKSLIVTKLIKVVLTLIALLTAGVGVHVCVCVSVCEVMSVNILSALRKGIY